MVCLNRYVCRCLMTNWPHGPKDNLARSTCQFRIYERSEFHVYYGWSIAILWTTDSSFSHSISLGTLLASSVSLFVSLWMPDDYFPRMYILCCCTQFQRRQTRKGAAFVVRYKVLHFWTETDRQTHTHRGGTGHMYTNAHAQSHTQTHKLAEP